MITASGSGEHAASGIKLRASQALIEGYWQAFAREGIQAFGGEIVKRELVADLADSMQASYSVQREGASYTMPAVFPGVVPVVYRPANNRVAYMQEKAIARKRITASAEDYPPTYRGLALFASYQTVRSYFMEKHPKSAEQLPKVDTDAMKIIHGVMRRSRKAKRAGKSGKRAA